MVPFAYLFFFKDYLIAKEHQIVHTCTSHQNLSLDSTPFCHEKSGLVRRVTFIEGGYLVIHVLYYLSTFDLWPADKGGLI
jgi:hypothetical protein